MQRLETVGGGGVYTVDNEEINCKYSSWIDRCAVAAPAEIPLFYGRCLQLDCEKYIEISLQYGDD